MINKLNLSFWISSDIETLEKEEEVIRWFESQRGAKIGDFSNSLNLDSSEAGLIQWARHILEIPDRVHFLQICGAKKHLAECALSRIARLFEAIDKAEFELTKEGVEPAAAFLLPKRLERLRAEFEIWRDAIRNGNFEVLQTRPYEKIAEYPELKNRYNHNATGLFPARRFSVKWQSEAAKVKDEPEEFRQIWLNPAEDIPFVLAALKDLEFIDEKENWRVAQYPNPLGPIIALMEYPKRSFFHNFSRIQFERAFCQRFKIEQPKKGFKPENKPFEISKTMMHKYLKEHG